MASQNNNSSQKNSSVGIGNEGSFDENKRDIPLQKSQTKKNNKSSKTSKENKDDKKQ